MSRYFRNLFYLSCLLVVVTMQMSWNWLQLFLPVLLNYNRSGTISPGGGEIEADFVFTL